MSGLRTVLKNVPSDAWVILSLMGGVYSYGAYVATHKMQETSYSPGTRAEIMKKLNSPFNGKNSI